jgi:hypothetical protein
MKMKYILATPTGIRVSGNSGDNEWEQETMNGSPAPVIIQYSPMNGEGAQEMLRAVKI